MELTRDQFIDQFFIPLEVGCLRLWRRRSKTAPIFLAGSFYEEMMTSRGRIAVPKAAFCDLVRPLIEALHRSTPVGGRPAGKLVAGLLYDTLNGAGVEVTLKPLVTIAPGK